jgi:hypothetical protein
MTLLQAYANYGKWNLWPQLQGECGCYSFFYATVLLRTLDPSGRFPEVHPRKFKQAANGDARKAPPGTTTVREFAKASLRSAQGELVTLDEIVSVILNFGYTPNIPLFKPKADKEDRKKAWITEQLTANHPVLIAFLEGYDPPQACKPVLSAVEGSPGPHWSVIVGETDRDYLWIDPHMPEKLKQHNKLRFIRSNGLTDLAGNLNDTPYWGKVHGGKGIGPAAGPVDPSYQKVYAEITAGGRSQSLNDALVAVS